MARGPRAFLAAFLAFAVFAGLGCKGVPANVAAATKPITLTVWGVFDDQDAYQQVIADYRLAHPYVQIQYVKLRPEEYETQLLNALAEDRGPDVFLMHDTWVHGYLPKIAPMPKTTTLAELVQSGTIQKQTTYELHQKPTLSVRQVQSLFPDQVVADAVVTVPATDASGNATQAQAVAGLPLSIDTLALYWNRDLLNAAGIAQPPATWNDFQTMTKKLVKTDAAGGIVQAAAGIGTQKNVDRATDILSLLMIQNGAQMANEEGYPTFNQIPAALAGEPTPPGVGALVFYTDFANPKKEDYTWNDAMPDALDAFVTGQSAMFLGYQYQLATIRARAPKLRFGVAPAPQVPGGVEANFANYWLYTVSKKSKHQDVAWDFVQFLTSQPEAKKYLDATRKPTALRALIPDQAQDTDLGVFAGQILTGQSWYRGADVAAAEQAMKDMIDRTVAGAKPEDAINTAVDRVEQTILPAATP